MPKAPCKDCPDRQVGCHSTCEKYIEFKKEADEQRLKRIEQGNINQYMREASERRYKHLKNRKRR